MRDIRPCCIRKVYPLPLSHPLQRVAAKIHEVEFRVAFGLSPHIIGDGDTTGRSKGPHSLSNIDPACFDLLPQLHDVNDVDSDPYVDCSIAGLRTVSLGKIPLNLACTSEGIDAALDP